MLEEDCVRGTLYKFWDCINCAYTQYIDGEGEFRSPSRKESKREGWSVIKKLGEQP